MLSPQITYTITGTTYLIDNQTGGLTNVSFVTRQETDQLFYRTKWSGKVVFRGKDFQRLWDVSLQTCCQLIQVAYYRRSRRCGDELPYWKGNFDISDLTFDIARSEAVLENAPRPDDGYQTLMENWGTSVNWLDMEAAQAIFTADRGYGTSRVYTRARLLTQFLASLVNLTLKSTTATSLVPSTDTNVVSSFLESPINPVTGRANQFYNACCIQASDFYIAEDPHDPKPTSYATKAELKLKDVVADLQALARLFPYIDPTTGKLRWEHESFFPQLSYAPATSQAGFSIPADHPAWRGKQSVSLDKEDVYGTYTLIIEPNVTLIPGERANLQANGLASDLSDTQSEAIANQQALAALSPLIGTNFSKATIEFYEPCTFRRPDQQKLEKTLTVSRFCTNLNFARLNKASTNLKDWIMLVASTPSTDPASLIPQIPYGKLDEFNLTVENAELSATTLVRDFHRHNQPFAQGFLDPTPIYNPAGRPMGMLSIAPLRNLGSVTVSYCCDDTPLSLTGLLETWYGRDGQLTEAKYSPATDQLTLEIAHAGPCQIARTVGPANPTTPAGPCPISGTLLRTESVNLYPVGSTTPNGVKFIFHFADGKCGEYTTESYLLPDIPR